MDDTAGEGGSVHVHPATETRFAVGEITCGRCPAADKTYPTSFRSTRLGPARVGRDALPPLPGRVAACGVSRGSSVLLARPPSGCWETAQPPRSVSFCLRVAAVAAGPDAGSHGEDDAEPPPGAGPARRDPAGCPTGARRLSPS